MDEKLIQEIAGNVMRRLNTDAGRAQYYAPWTSVAYESDAHPSQQLFNIGEATEAQSSVKDLVEFLETKECSIEKGKTCDHCGTCRSLGF